MSDTLEAEPGEATPDAPATAKPPAAEPKLRPWWLSLGRGLVFVALVAFFFSGIAARQVAKVKEPWASFTPAWMMFGGAGVGRSQVEYWTVSADGEKQAVDPHELLGVRHSKKAKELFRISGREAAHRMGHKLCKKLGPDTDLRMRVRTARRTGWRIEERGKRNICKVSPSVPPKKKKKRKKKKTKKGKAKS